MEQVSNPLFPVCNRFIAAKIFQVTFTLHLNPVTWFSLYKYNWVTSMRFNDFGFLSPPKQLHCHSLSWFILTKCAGLVKLLEVSVELLMVWPYHFVMGCLSLHSTHTPGLSDTESCQHWLKPLTADTPSRLSHEDNTLHPNITVVMDGILTQGCQKRQLPAPTFVPWPVLCRIALMSFLCLVCTPLCAAVMGHACTPMTCIFKYIRYIFNYIKYILRHFSKSEGGQCSLGCVRNM